MFWLRQATLWVMSEIAPCGRSSEKAKVDWQFACSVARMIRKLKSGVYRLYSSQKDAKLGKRKNLGTFSTRAAAVKHEREVQYFKRAG
jgi:hypothetical protein